jgi:hypothetical protein
VGLLGGLWCPVFVFVAVVIVAGVVGFLVVHRLVKVPLLMHLSFPFFLCQFKDGCFVVFDCSPI